MMMTPNEMVRDLLNKGMRQDKLAEMLGVSQSSVNRYANAGTKPGYETARRIADIHAQERARPKSQATSEGPPIPASILPVLGYVGAGARIFEVDGSSGDDPLEEVELDFPMPPDTAAAIVRGDSMLPAFEDGDLVGYRRSDGSLAELINELCILKTAEGATYIKTLRRGRRDGLYTLTSFNASDIEDVEIEWAAPFIFRVSRRNWRRHRR